ncbi:MAG: mechanosensitive ion channel family protein [Dethiobacter sp.]|jgi:small conductance mechanosensitive channel|nr:mechanosensitive ion channel family protein [Dethiobacter sp.]MBS3901900.1 mechanosensitive ion channel family protein [Dethiobacter sp.]MBS3988828.1 mechanosensitive ion channel family protein [Dethiobacter sp.]
MVQELQQLDLSRASAEQFLLPLALSWGARVFAVLVIIVFARFALHFGHAFIEKLLAPSLVIKEGKAKTLVPLLKSIWRYTVYALTVVTVLSRLQIMDIGPILAGAGIVGLAVGFGAQNLVRDVISGFFLILEDQFSVGDFITVGAFSGEVEELGLRITKIRDFSGEVHIIPNGRIEAVTNRTRGNMRAMIDVRISHDKDVDEVLALLAELMREYAQGEPSVVEGPTVLGVTDLSDAFVQISIAAHTVAMKQWQVEREMRRLIKKKFAEKGI